MSLKTFLPGSVEAYGIIPFLVITLVSLICCGLFMRYYWKRRERDCVSIFVTTFGLWIALLSSFLLPLDVFMISFMKNNDGTFKDWASNSTRISVENGMTYTYYTLYSLVVLCMFFLLPFVYFFYEEKDEDERDTAKRCTTALCYAVGFLIAAAILMVIGAVVPYRGIPPQNGTDYTEFVIIQQLFARMVVNRGVDALYFILNILMLIGMLVTIVYTGVGFAAFPIMNVRGWRSIKSETEVLEEKKATLAVKKANLESKGTLSRSQQSKLQDIEDEERLLLRMENEIKSVQHGFYNKIFPLIKVLQIILGIIGIVLGALIWTGLLLTSIDKLMNSLGFKDGYLLSVTHIPNPLDYIMVQCQKVFPIDYVFYFAIVVFFLFCTFGGISEMGICCFCIKMFRIRPHRTAPQALIILCVIMMYSVLALNFVLYSTLPQYTTFGSQHYYNTTSQIPVPCSHESPEGECLMTRMSVFLLVFSTKAVFFGIAYFWMIFAFLLVVVLGFFWALLRKKRSFIKEAVDRDDFEDSDSDIEPIVA